MRIASDQLTRDGDEPSGAETASNADSAGRWATVLTTALFVLWCAYSLNGFRGWWVPITINDADAGSGIRQVLFLGSALISALMLWITGQVWGTIRAQWPLLVLGVWMVASAAYSELPATTIKRSVLFGCGCVTAATVAGMAHDPLRFVARLLAGVASSAALLSIAWWALFPAGVTTNPMRPGLAGISNHPNTLGPALALGVVWCLAAPWGGRWELPIRLGSALLCATALVMTTSITSLGLGLVGLGLFLVFVISAYTRVVVALGAALALLGGSLIGLSRIGDSMLGSVGRDATMSGRGELWSLIAAEIRETPLFGRGWGAFWTEGKGRELVGTWNPRQSHNAYLDVILDLGILGALLFAVVVGSVVVLLFREYVRGTGRRVLCAGLLTGVVSLLAIYAWQQSFLGKVDSFPFISMIVIATAALQARTVAGPATAAAADERADARDQSQSGINAEVDS